MDTSILNLMEILLFFAVFPIVFQAFNAFDTTRIFRKGFVWQIQALYIMGSVIITYLFCKAIINLIYLSSNIFT